MLGYLVEERQYRPGEREQTGVLEIGLRRRARGRNDGHPHGPLDGIVQQRRLADPRFPTDHQRAALAAPSLLQQALDPGLLSPGARPAHGNRTAVEGLLAGDRRRARTVDECCWGVGRSERGSSAFSMAPATDAAGCSCCAVNRGSARRPCSATPSELAESMTALWATGLPAEAELEYSGLVELLRPVVPLLERLPEHQATVLREALGLAPPGDRRDRFAVGAALLGLFAAAADARPMLVVVDDAQWLDHASADALRFAARRVSMDRVAILVAVRDGEGREFDTTGFDELAVGGLGPEDVGALLGRSGNAALPRAAVQRVHDVTGGNPLAVIELGEVVPADVLRHHDEPTPMPVGPAIQRAFARRAGELPERARRALLVAAVAMVADVETIDRALAGLGLTLEALEQAEDAGLVSIDRGVVEFEHPLVRSAVHSAATASERRAVHRALADALAAGGDQDRRAWHLAGAALGPDEEAAAALEGLAWRSRERGGHAAASAALEHAARLTPDGLVRLDRLAGAAEAAWGGGAPATATTLLDEALTGCRDPARRARLLSLRGRIEHEIGHQVKSRELLLEAASLIEQVDPPGAASILLYSLAPIHYGGDVDEGLRVAERARELAPRDGSDLDTRADSFLGWALFQAGRGAEGVPILERAIRALPVTGASRPQLRRAAISLSLLERSAESEQLVQQVVDVARREGPTALSYALDQAARYAVRSGAWSRAVAIGEEGLALTEEIGTAADVANILVTLARVDAACGHEDRCRERITAATETAAAHGLDTVLHQGHAVVGLLDLGLGRLEPAAEELERVARSVEQLGAFTRDLTAEPDLVEALLRLGRVGEAHEWLEAYAARGRGRAPGGLLRLWPVAGACWRGATTSRPATCRRRWTSTVLSRTDSRKPGRCSASASGCAAPARRSTPASASARPSPASRRSAQCRGPSGRGPSCAPPVKRSAGPATSSVTTSRRRSCRSPSRWPTARRTRKPRRPCSSVRRRSSSISLGCIPSWVSVPVPS